MTKGIFITATGTDIGKTYVSALIVKSMRKAGLNCGYYKPALSGAQTSKDGTLIPGDCAYVFKNAGLTFRPKIMFHIFLNRQYPRIWQHKLKTSQ